jgi:hypothetical protein
VRVNYLDTGIGTLAAARRYLRRKWGQAPLPPIERRPGARFYVTARQGARVAYLLGPYVSHMTALAAVPRGERLLRQVYPSLWLQVGTASLPVTVPTRFGR